MSSFINTKSHLLFVGLRVLQCLVMSQSRVSHNQWLWKHTSLANTFCSGPERVPLAPISARLLKMWPRFQALLLLIDVWKEYLCHSSTSPVQRDGSSAQLHHRRKEVHVTGGLIYLPATWDGPWPAQDSRDPDPSLPVGGLPRYSEKHSISYPAMQVIILHLTATAGW